MGSSQKIPLVKAEFSVFEILAPVWRGAYQPVGLDFQLIGLHGRSSVTAAVGLDRRDEFES